MLFVGISYIRRSIFMYGDYLMYRYSFWPGTYSFKNEIAMFLTAIKDQIEVILNKLEKTATYTE